MWAKELWSNDVCESFDTSDIDIRNDIKDLILAKWEIVDWWKIIDLSKIDTYSLWELRLNNINYYVLLDSESKPIKRIKKEDVKKECWEILEETKELLNWLSNFLPKTSKELDNLWNKLEKSFDKMWEGLIEAWEKLTTKLEGIISIPNEEALKNIIEEELGYSIINKDINIKVINWDKHTSVTYTLSNNETVSISLHNGKIENFSSSSEKITNYIKKRFDWYNVEERDYTTSGRRNIENHIGSLKGDWEKLTKAWELLYKRLKQSLGDKWFIYKHKLPALPDWVWELILCSDWANYIVYTVEDTKIIRITWPHSKKLKSVLEGLIF